MKKILFALAIVTPLFAEAGRSDGVITDLAINAYDEIIVKAGPISELPACATLEKFAVDATTTHGKLIYPTLLTALAQNKPVKIVGKNTCDVRANAETIQFIQILN